MKMEHLVWTWCERRASNNESPREGCIHWHGTLRAESGRAQWASCYLQLRGAHMDQLMAKCARNFGNWIVLALLLTTAAIPAGAQKKDKNKNPQPADLTDEMRSAMRAPDSQAIDQAIGEELGYWQIGDVENLHKYYAEDVVIVSGAWEPPVIGWDNFLKS